MAVMRVCKLGGEDAIISQKKEYIRATLKLSIGETVWLRDTPIKIVCPDYLCIGEEPKTYSLPIMEFVSKLNSVELEKFLGRVVEASQNAAPVSWEEFKKQNNINGSVRDTLELRQVKRGGDTKISDFVPF